MVEMQYIFCRVITSRYNVTLSEQWKSSIFVANQAHLPNVCLVVQHYWDGIRSTPMCDDGTKYRRQSWFRGRRRSIDPVMIAPKSLKDDVAPQ